MSVCYELQAIEGLGIRGRGELSLFNLPEIAPAREEPHLLVMKNSIAVDDLIETWSLPIGLRLGSCVRSKGIFLEVRARLPLPLRQFVTIRAGEISLRLPRDAGAEFQAASRAISQALSGVERLAVLPREIEDILAISTAERRRWLQDGRLRSAGKRTVKFRGRAKQVTFHVFDPKFVEDVLNRDLISEWRDEDAATAAENRRRAALKRRLTGSAKRAVKSEAEASSGPGLVGWEEFEREGPLR